MSDNTVRDAYVNRPPAAGTGPETRLDSPPPAPRSRPLLSRRHRLVAAGTIIPLVLALVAIGSWLDSTTPMDALGTAAGALLGAAVASAVGYLVILRRRGS